MTRSAFWFMVFGLILPAAALAQVKQPEVAVGHKYTVKPDSALYVFPDAKRMSDALAAHKRMDFDYMQRGLKNGDVLVATAGATLEITKVEPKSEAFPNGLLEFRRTSADGKVDSVVMQPDSLTGDGVSPANATTPRLLGFRDDVTPYRLLATQRYLVHETFGAFATAKALNEFAAVMAAKEADKAAAMVEAGLKDGSVIQMTSEATILEVVKIERVGPTCPGGLVEMKRTVVGGKTDTVFVLPANLCPKYAQITYLKEPVGPEEPPVGGQAGGKVAGPVIRTWKAAAGGFEVQAELIKLDGEKLVLKRKGDGKEISITSDKLSAEDRQWLAAISQLEGTWEVTGMEVSGMAVPPPEKFSFSFEKGKFKVVTMGGVNGDGRVGLDAKNPKAMDLFYADDEDGKAVKGIYQITGDTLKFCAMEQSDGERPTNFVTKGKQFALVTFKRIKN